MNRRILFRVVGFLLIAAVISGGYLIWRGIKTSIEAEYNLHAVIVTLNALEAFVSEHNRWPSSWEELVATSKPLPGSMFQFPQDADIIRNRVRVRFDASPAELSNPRESKLIVPLGPYYPYEHRLEPLYDRIENLRPE